MITMKQLGRVGRFGNQLFQIAGIIGIARKNNHEFCFPRWENIDHKERFGSSEDCDVQKFFENPLPEYVDRYYQYRWIEWGYHDVRLYQDHHFDLGGHFQSEKYFRHAIDEVRYYLKMKNEHALMTGVCAIHFRAGDYIDDPNAYHPRLTMNYYRSAMERMPSGTHFLVFSDDMDRARQMFGGDVEYSDTGSYIEDFKLMKTCNHFITANSSFSLMPAILSDAQDKIVVCPSKWFGPIAGITGVDCYPEKSIVI